MRHFLAVTADLEEDGVFDPPAQVYRHSQGVGHDNQIGENANGSQENVSVARDDLNRSERLGERFQGRVKFNQTQWPVSEHLPAITRPAGMPLILAGKRAPTFRAAPGHLHIAMP
jgi:hypothetical protein